MYVRSQEECNSYACQYDSTECSYNVSVYKDCSAIQQGIHCFNLFRNGICDNACRSEGCLFDGFDCQPEMKRCNPFYDAYCINHYGNGYCDEGCNTEECSWDGLDCVAIQSSDSVVPGSLFVVVGIPPDEFMKVKTSFLRGISQLFRANVLIELDESGNEKIFPFPDSRTRNKRDIKIENGSMIYLKLDNSNCEGYCFHDTNSAVQYLAQSLKEGWESNVPILKVGGKGGRL